MGNSLPEGECVSSSSCCVTRCRQRQLGKAREKHCGCGLCPLKDHCLISPGTLVGVSPGSSGIGASRHHPWSVDLFSPLISGTPVFPSLGFCLTFLCLFLCLCFSFEPWICGTSFRSRTQKCSLFLIFKSTDFTFCFELSLGEVLGTETLVDVGSSAALPHSLPCSSLPLDPCSFWGHGAGLWSPLIIFRAHWYT